MTARMIGLPGYQVDPEKIGMKPVDALSFQNELMRARAQREAGEVVMIYGREFMAKSYYLRYLQHPDGNYYELQTGHKGPGESMSLPKGWINDQLPDRLGCGGFSLADLVGMRMAVLFARNNEAAIGDPRLMSIVSEGIDSLLDSSIPPQPTPSETNLFGVNEQAWF